MLSQSPILARQATVGELSQRPTFLPAAMRNRARSIGSTIVFTGTIAPRQYSLETTVTEIRAGVLRGFDPGRRWLSSRWRRLGIWKGRRRRAWQAWGGPPRSLAGDWPWRRGSGVEGREGGLDGGESGTLSANCVAEGRPEGQAAVLPPLASSPLSPWTMRWESRDSPLVATTKNSEPLFSTYRWQGG